MGTHQEVDSTDRDDLRRVLPWFPDRDVFGTALWSVFGIAVVSFLAFLVLLPNREILLALPVMLAGAGMLSGFLRGRSSRQLAGWLLAGGFWGFVVATAISIDGLEGPSAVAYPAVVVTIGWLFGVRAALGAAVLAVVIALAMIGIEPFGVPLDSLRGHPIGNGLSQFIALSLSAALVAYFAQLYQDRLADLRQAGRELDGRAQALKASEADLARAQAVARVGSWIRDPADGRMSLSAEACRIFGIAAGDTMRDEDLLARVPAEDAARLAAAWDAAVRGVPFDLEHRVVVDGQERWVRQKAEVEPPGRDAASRVLGIIQDITERKHAEAQLADYQHHLEQLVAERTTELSVAKEAAESASRAKSVFLTTMSHELRTPMQAIMGMTAIAARRTTDPRLLDPLDKARLAADRLLALINDILDISRIESERLTLDSAYFDLGSLRENLLTLLGRKAAEKGLALEFPPVPDLAGLVLVGDPLRLGQIVLNLAGNAIKFTESGRVAIRVRALEQHDTEILLRWEVEDSGIGIAPDARTRIFSAFEQVDGSLSRRYGGTGLGLAICSRLVHMMGGEIGVDGHPGRGSTFWFTVRLGKSSTASLARTEERQVLEMRLRQEFAGTPVLLVDDDTLGQDVERAMLESVGLAVDLAPDHQTALALASQSSYALILMDMKKGDFAAGEACRAIRDIPGHARTPVVALSSALPGRGKGSESESVFSDRVGKPVAPDRLFAVVLKCLEAKAS